MRIISGKFKGCKLDIPIDKETRPLKDLTKESIFNVLMHSKICFKELTNSNVLDCFSGTGSFGLECISRGSKKTIFLENYGPALKVLYKNIRKLKVEQLSKVYSGKIESFFSNTKDINFDVIFLDPPYKFSKISEIFNNLHFKKLLEKNGVIIIHRHKNSYDLIPKIFKKVEEKIYGISKIGFYKLNN